MQQGDRYRHYKGGEVIIRLIAKHTETGEDMIIYSHGGLTWARPRRIFEGMTLRVTDGVAIPRFTKIEGVAE